MSTFHYRYAILSVLAATACGGGQSEAEAPSDTAGEGAAALPDTWSHDMSHDQQAEFMKARVVPAMSGVFQTLDADEFAEFGCETCHGPEFKDPPEFLPTLTMKDGKIAAFEEAPEVATFMSEKVIPAMADAMGLAPYDPETHEGFGCGGCHTIKQQ